MKILASFVLTFLGMNAFAQTSTKTAEMFLGVPVIKHHTVVKAGDSVVLPSRAYIMEVYMIEHGDYVIYNNNAPFVVPDIPGIEHMVYRNEGEFEIDGKLKSKAFDPAGNEKYPDQVIVSRQAQFHLYYFTLANEAPRFNWTLNSQATAASEIERRK